MIASPMQNTHRHAWSVKWTLTDDLEFCIIELMTCICQLAVKNSQGH